METFIAQKKFSYFIDHAGEALFGDEIVRRLTKLAYCLNDHNGILVEVNEAYAKLYGYEVHELIGQHFTIVVPEEGREYAKKINKNFIEGSNELPGEWTVVNKRGEPMRIYVEAVRCENRNGDPPCKLTFVERID